jgi:hypothetical protein
VNKLKLLAVVPMAGAALFLGTGAALAAASISASPTTVSDGTSVTVSLTGFKASESVACVQTKGASQADADLSNVQMGTTDASGKATIKITVHSGKGDMLACGATDQSESATTAISFGSAAATTSAASSAAATSAASTASAAPAVSAGTGGHADRNGVPTGVIVLGAVGALAIAGGAVRFARR